MDFTKTTPPLSRRSSRRSFPNLTHLSLAPLSSHFPIDDDAQYDPTSPSFLPTSSYIQGKSAPSTPRILSRSPSRHSRSRRAMYVHEGHSVAIASAADPDRFTLTKAQSTSALVFARPGASTHKGAKPPGSAHPEGRHHVRRHTGPRGSSDATWFYRAGLAIASETRESKGQSWLVSRESSTTILGDGPGPGPLGRDGELRSPGRWSRGSRPGTAPGSARHSRVGSRAGSRAELHAGGVRGGAVAHGDYFGDVGGPDFVDEAVWDEVLPRDASDSESESSVDEEEVARLAREQSANFGGWVDRLMGWTLFEVEDDGDDADGREATAAAADTAEDRRKQEAGSGSVNVLPAAPIPPPAQEGGWKDAAWLLSVAAKVVL